MPRVEQTTIMEIILSKTLIALTGQFSKENGYAVRRRGKRFFSARNSRGTVHYYDHWEFIVSCAELAQSKMYISDIVVSKKEFFEAIREAKLRVPEERVQIDPLYACDVMNIKKYYNL